MKIYVYSDESGVFDHIHNDYYVFGGLILLGDTDRDDWRRKYASVEKCVRSANNYSSSLEIKASTVSNKFKAKIFRSLNGCNKFACVIDQQRVIPNIWNNKKDKQRYLDFAYKISVKNALMEMVQSGEINPENVEGISFFVDEHTTATNGRYELREALERELKIGTYNMTYSKFFPPLFPGMENLTLDYCNSAAPKNRLIRAADIVANTVFHYAIDDKVDKLDTIPHFHCSRLP